MLEKTTHGSMLQKTSTEFCQRTFDIPIAGQTIPDSDIKALSDWLRTNPRLTAGDQVKLFESKFAEYLGRKYAVMVNSGSSANLLALSAYKALYHNSNKKVVLPALSWSTDISPILQLGMEPIFVDCEPATLHMNPVALREVLKKYSPSCVLFVDILGIPSPVCQEVLDLCLKNNVFMIEDCCESLGTVYRDEKTGTYGNMSTFSFYYSHQISTIEGGAVVTDDDDLYDILVSMRAHGWARDTLNLYDHTKKMYGLDDFEMQFTFVNTGYNLRSTDLNAFIGLRQLSRLEEVAEKRNNNFRRLKNIFQSIGSWTPPCDGVACALAYPILTKDRKRAVSILSDHSIESRPIIAGNISRQPMLNGRPYLYPICDLIHERGLYISVIPDLNDKDFETIEKAVSSDKCFIL